MVLQQQLEKQSYLYDMFVRCESRVYSVELTWNKFKIPGGFFYQDRFESFISTLKTKLI